MIWDKERRSKAERMEKAAGYARGKRVGTEETVPFLGRVTELCWRAAIRSRPHF